MAVDMPGSGTRSHSTGSWGPAIESFGTWRDAEGRLAWGIDDFDEAYPLPYTNDLLRLATSVRLAIEAGHLGLKNRVACEAIVAGYLHGLKHKGCSFVCAQEDDWLNRLGLSELRRPVSFWSKMERLPGVSGPTPLNVRRVLARSLPGRDLPYRVVRRVSGLGSLGRARYVALADWHGGLIAREAKAATPSACCWVNRHNGASRLYYQEILKGAVRSPDPCQRLTGKWVVRRLCPDSNPIEIADLPKKRDEEILLFAMGCETANVHLGSVKQLAAVKQEMERRGSKWLRAAAKKSAEFVGRDWSEWKAK
ncbi:MAG: DUF2252 domain-containing protein [Acidobacteriota bacterium]|nr:DUF2252 domain-containing protein [Acidobacteriota bacterium]